MISRQDTGLQSSDMFPFLVDENSVFSNHLSFQVWVASHYQQNGLLKSNGVTFSTLSEWINTEGKDLVWLKFRGHIPLGQW